MPNYPYISTPKGLADAFAQFRKAGFPAKLDAAYLKRFKIASANESYLISILRFLGMIDDDGAKVDDHVAMFYGGDDVFQPGLKERMKDAYSQLFDEMGGDAALTTDRSDLTNWFRGADKTSELVGGRQASTFLTLAGLATGNNLPKPRATSGSSPRKRAKPAARKNGEQAAAQTEPKSTDATTPPAPRVNSLTPDVGLAVRIEVNLPAGEDPATYDAIFASIKRHLMP